MVPALIGRISFTGELGYEIWVSNEYQRALYDLLQAAGRERGMKLCGARALNTLRIEKSFGTWAREFRPIYGPHEAGLGRFVDFKKGDFVGRAAALEERDSGGKLRLVTFSVDAADADASGDEPIWHRTRWSAGSPRGPSAQRAALAGTPLRTRRARAGERRLRDRDPRRTARGDTRRRRGGRSSGRADARLRPGARP
jgi:glycine cleavage system aminomethyltransferase T